MMAKRVCERIEVGGRILRIVYFYDVSSRRTENHIREARPGRGKENRGLGHKSYLFSETELFHRNALEAGGLKDAPNHILVFQTPPLRVFAAYENLAIRDTGVWSGYFIANSPKQRTREIIDADNSEFIYV